MLNGLKFSRSFFPVINIKVHLFSLHIYAIIFRLVPPHQLGSVVLDLINILNLGKFNLRTLDSSNLLEFIFTVATFCA